MVTIYLLGYESVRSMMVHAEQGGASNGGILVCLAAIPSPRGSLASAVSCSGPVEQHRHVGNLGGSKSE